MGLDRIVRDRGVPEFAMNKELVLEGVYRGPAALSAILMAFMRARGEFDIGVTIGTERERPGEVMVLVEIGAIKAVFTPRELRVAGEAIVETIPRALAFGAPQSDADEMRNFADILLRNADDAAAVSPHGLH
jgi:hypothetical protein